MAAKTHNPTSFPSFSRIGFGLSPNSNSAAAPPQKSKQGKVDEKWYILYNYLCEPPRKVPQKTTARGRWGDVALEHTLNDSVASSSNVRKRTGAQHDRHAQDASRAAQKVSSVEEEERRYKVQEPFSPIWQE